MEIGQKMDRQLLERLEEELWREVTRFDRARMNEVFSVAAA
jgi:hypothetical protein